MITDGAREIRVLVEACVQASAPGLHIAHEGIWLHVGMNRMDPNGRSGWKIHLSAVPDGFEVLLRRTLPLVLDAGFSFKCADSWSTVEKLNSGEYGLSQVGKVVTIYVGPPEQVSALGAALAGALRGLPGPRIIHDCRLSEDGPVYARFGPFDGAFRVDATGRARRVLLHPEQGEIIDPTDGGAVSHPEAPGIPHYEAYDHLAFIRDRFVIVGLLHLSAKGGVFFAIDREAPKAGLQLLKTARAWTNSDIFGRDARWALRREQAWLERLAGLPGVPPAGTLIEGEETTVLCRPYLEGATFWELWTKPDARSEAGQARLHWVLDELEQHVVPLHQAGCIVRDLSPGNILWGDDDATWILDFELAAEVGSNEAPYRRGTKGFYDENQDRLAPAVPEDDEYALARLRSMATGASLQLTPNDESLCRQTKEDSKRQIETSEEMSKKSPAVHSREATELDWEEVFGFLVKYYQTSERERSWGPDAYTVYDGSAGLYLFLHECAELSPETRREPEMLAETEKWRQSLESLRHLPGAYFGASGLALALCHYGARKDEALLIEGRACFLELSLTPSSIPDLCQGVAGLGLAAWAARSVLSSRDLESILAHVGVQLETQCVEDEDGIWWPWPEGAAYGGFSGEAYLGFAHGLAGILWLASMVKSQSGPDLLPPKMLEAGFATLLRHGRSLSGGGMWWPVSRGDETCWNAWCHGTPGVVKALAAGHALGLVESANLRAGLLGMGAANSGELCLCHGVASRLDAYADAFAALPDLGADVSIATSAKADHELLAEALRQSLVGKSLLEPGKGLMTGLAGIARSLFRYDLGFDGVYRKLLP